MTNYLIIKKMKFFLTIAASDNSGGAGIQQDIKVADSLGLWGLSSVTGITVQDFNGVDKIYPVDHNILKEQIEINFNSFNISAVKTGALCSTENIRIVSELLIKYKPENIVVDTVFAPSSGNKFINDEDIDIYVKTLFPVAHIITPNRNELSLIAKQDIKNIDHAAEIALELSEQYGCTIYVTGGHFSGSTVKEALITNGIITFIEKERITMKYTHGTGCTFSSALACYLANGHPLHEACKKATEYVSKLYKNN